MGKCLTQESEWKQIRDNIPFYYNCSDVSKENFAKNEVFINETFCGPLSDFPEQLFDIPVYKRKSAAQEYFLNEVLNESDGIENMGPVQWKLCLCLLAAWIVIFFCLIKGIKSSGKVVYFTATFPYFVLLILLIKAATLEGKNSFAFLKHLINSVENETKISIKNPKLL